MLLKFIRIQGARTHNLKNINVSIPRDKLTVVTGLSGSGKSSLAFDTLYAEGQRRYVESLSAYARQFLSMMEKPDVDSIEGLSPAISIEQKSTSHNPRSTVGTVTEIYDYLRLLFARVGTPHCPTHKKPLKAQTISQMVDSVLAYPEGTKILVLAPIVRTRKGEHANLLEQMQGQGFVRARINGQLIDLDDAPDLDLQSKHTIDIVVDRLKVRDDHSGRLAESLETALSLTDGLASVVNQDSHQEQLFSAKFACPHCGFAVAELEPRLFSFNSPIGACSKCDGLGVEQFFDPAKVVRDEELTLEAGAICGWSKRNFYYFQLIQSIAQHYEFSLEDPFSSLPKKIQEILLYGSGDESIPFELVNTRGRRKKRRHPFEGVLVNMERRYHETDSNIVRDELVKYMTLQPCTACSGQRLGAAARSVLIDKKSLPDLSALSIKALLDFFDALNLSGQQADIAEKILKEIHSRLHFLLSVGLGYLSLSRSAETLSGGEAQRIRLASQIGSGLVGVMYILDEPTIGLHQKDNERLLKTLVHLRDLGNTVIMVEHDEDAIWGADHVIDIGPGAGVLGGAVVSEGTPKQVAADPNSLTGRYLSGKECIAVPACRLSVNPKKVIKLQGAECNNLKNVDVTFPLGLMTCITGVSGSGKSSLVNDTLYPLLAEHLGLISVKSPGKYGSISGLASLDKAIVIDQSPIGRTPRSNPATYTGLFTPIRELFAGTEEARLRGYQIGRFSFNVKGGRCEACSGDGLIRVEMHFLADVYVTCEVCQGSRYNRETLSVNYKGKSIHDVLNMTVTEALDFFAAVPVIARKLQTLLDVGLGYIGLGQSATTLSGGEAQRIKLSKELSKRDTGSTLYLLDEPTTGLHFHDIKQLLKVLHRLKERGNTIVVIEHNLDVIKTADWIIDLGPEGGDQGGEILAVGTPEHIAKISKSFTGQFLKPLLKAREE